MQVADLYHLPVEPELLKWLAQFSELSDLFMAIPQLFARLTQTLIIGAVEEGAVLVGPVHVGEGSIVRANSIIVGPVILGPRVIVNYGAVVRCQSYIGPECAIDSGSIITHSLLLNR